MMEDLTAYDQGYPLSIYLYACRRLLCSLVHFRLQYLSTFGAHSSYFFLEYFSFILPVAHAHSTISALERKVNTHFIVLLVNKLQELNMHVNAYGLAQISETWLIEMTQQDTTPYQYGKINQDMSHVWITISLNIQV